ncbi:acetate kinase [Metallumcola ferriviriculae]|uniref:Acetate kinase n=1 Tax=Metallumcola ferriviriculae TaxID=3039180 RepID=A0AAU0ULG0_9FIRM|nr:acetate kinase [Desulfitibacteraceae bacterium MK1]
MKVLVINCGSSSLKYQLFDIADENVLAKGLVERIGSDASQLTHQPKGKGKYVRETAIGEHQAAIKMVMDLLTDAQYGVLTDIREIEAVGHRVAHGGNVFSRSALIDDEVKQGIRKLAELAPLHNPPNLLGIEAAEKILPGVPQVAVFDTAFHQTIEPEAYMYSLPYELYEKYAIRKYGFHGTSHKFVAQRAAELMGKELSQIKVITCHLGNGASVTAIDGGVSKDTSMGFTPLEGLTMGTRCGDLDPAIVPFLMEKEGLDTTGISTLLNKKSGVLGLSGVSSDFRDIEQAASRGNERAQLAIDVFVHDVKKYIGAYAAILNGIDALVFTAGLGENSPEVRDAVCIDMDYLGIGLDKEKNGIRGKEMEVSAADSTVRVFVIPTNEELMIARDTKRLGLDT